MALRSTGLEYKDRVTIFISWIALCLSLVSAAISGVNTYVQWFFKSPSLNIKLSEHDVEWRDNKDNDPEYAIQRYPDKLFADIPIAFVNSGNQSILVQDMRFQLFGRKQPGLDCVPEDENFRSSVIKKWQFFVESDRKTSAVPVITKPGEIVAHTIQFEGIYGNRRAWDSWTGCVFFEVLDPQGEVSYQRVMVFAIVPSTYNTSDMKTKLHSYANYEFKPVPQNTNNVASSQTIIFNRSVEKLNLQDWVR
jgi:hypothetical protein